MGRKEIGGKSISWRIQAANLSERVSIASFVEIDAAGNKNIVLNHDAVFSFIKKGPCCPGSPPPPWRCHRLGLFWVHVAPASPYRGVIYWIHSGFIPADTIVCPAMGDGPN